MIKKIAYIFIFIVLTSCATVKEKTSGIKEKTSGIKEIGNIVKECPPKEERTLKHIFCKEPK